MDPKDAASPKDRVSAGTVRVVYTHPSTDWSVATMIYDDHPAVGMRWNGDIGNRQDLGYPSARGNGAWFILPEEVAGLVMALVGAVSVARGDEPEGALSSLFFGARFPQPQA